MRILDEFLQAFVDFNLSNSLFTFQPTAELVILTSPLSKGATMLKVSHKFQKVLAKLLNWQRIKSSRRDISGFNFDMRSKSSNRYEYCR